MRGLCYSFSEQTFVYADNLPLPEPHEDEILIEVKACGITNVDWNLISGLQKHNEQTAVPGYEVSGAVIKIGTTALKRFEIGDHVVGFVPFDQIHAGCAEYCTVKVYDVVSKPDSISHSSAVGLVASAVDAYTALFYMTRMTAGDTILISDAAKPRGFLMMQLAQLWGAKVIGAVKDEQEAAYCIAKLATKPARIMVWTEDKGYNAVLEETGGLGVDIIIQAEDCISGSHLISKHDILRLLSVHGSWVTTDPALQLDPPDSQMLHAKNARVCFLNSAAWVLASSQQGRLLHILEDSLKRLARNEFVVDVRVYGHDRMADAWKDASLNTTGKIVAIPQH
eukprot:Colp12_sorted_trinity150504_noHs@30260